MKDAKDKKMIDREEKGQMARFVVLFIDAITTRWKNRTKEEFQRHAYDTGMALIDSIYQFDDDKKLPEGKTDEQRPMVAVGADDGTAKVELPAVRKGGEETEGDGV